MPISWDNEYENPEVLGDFVEKDFAPSTFPDPDFNGLAVGCTEVCRVHNLVPQRCVAFGGTDTGRRFYMCSLENEVNNCGFVSWVDAEWPETLKNALRKLWGMYDESDSGRIAEKIESGNMIQRLFNEKNRAEKDYASLMNDINKFLHDTARKVRQENFEKIMNNVPDTVEELKREVEWLRNEIAMLKNVQKTQADVMKGKEKKWDEDKQTMHAEMEAMKAEKKRLEYALHDLFLLNATKKEKLDRIKSLCDD